MQVGYTTVHTFVMMPKADAADKGMQHRLRLSQLLVLPPYQRQGVATQLVNAVYALAAQRDAYDITVSVCNHLSTGAKHLNAMCTKHLNAVCTKHLNTV